MTKHLVVLLNQLSDKDGEVSLEHLDKHALRELLNEVEGEDHHVNQVIVFVCQINWTKKCENFQDSIHIKYLILKI